MNKKQLICINCPRGCALDAEWNDRSDLKVTGNSCPRGIEYAASEIFNPVRILTATVKTTDSKMKRIPVKSLKPVNKEMIPVILNELYKFQIPLPVASGDIVLKNAMESGIDIVATRSSE